jgi:Leucine-rich repeat (LRR) protein
MGSLETLDMNGVPLLDLTQQDCSNKINLHFLDLSGSKITMLPSEFFSEMSNLEELILGNCIHLKQLPPSLAQLSNLLIFHLEGTQIVSFPVDTFEAMQRLHTLKFINNMLLMSLLTSLSKAIGLRELHIDNCRRLTLQFLWELVPGLEDLYIQTWENIRSRRYQNPRTPEPENILSLWTVD